MAGDIQHNMKGSPLRRKCALYSALVSLCLLVGGVVLAETCDSMMPLAVVGFPSMLPLLALGSLSGGFMWPDSLSDADWVIVIALSIIPSVCFWAGAGWTVGYFIDKRKGAQQTHAPEIALRTIPVMLSVSRQGVYQSTKKRF